ncbi:hypothetical protein RI367_002617 [Sorochytrium milnesiophthora]
MIPFPTAAYIPPQASDKATQRQEDAAVPSRPRAASASLPQDIAVSATVDRAKAGGMSSSMSSTNSLDGDEAAAAQRKSRSVSMSASEAPDKQISNTASPTTAAAAAVPAIPLVARQSKNAAFHALFKQISEQEFLIEDFSCALQKEILVQGRLYITSYHVCFNATIFGRWGTTLVIPFVDIVNLEKKMTAFVFANAIEITVKSGPRYFFASFIFRELAFNLMASLWRTRNPEAAAAVGLELPSIDAALGFPPTPSAPSSNPDLFQAAANAILEADETAEELDNAAGIGNRATSEHADNSSDDGDDDDDSSATFSGSDTESEGVSEAGSDMSSPEVVDEAKSPVTPATAMPIEQPAPASTVTSEQPAQSTYAYAASLITLPLSRLSFLGGSNRPSTAELVEQKPSPTAVTIVEPAKEPMSAVAADAAPPSATSPSTTPAPSPAVSAPSSPQPPRATASNIAASAASSAASAFATTLSVFRPRAKTSAVVLTSPVLTPVGLPTSTGGTDGANSSVPSSERRGSDAGMTGSDARRSSVSSGAVPATPEPKARTFANSPRVRQSDRESEAEQSNDTVIARRLKSGVSSSESSLFISQNDGGGGSKAAAVSGLGIKTTGLAQPPTKNVVFDGVVPLALHQVYERLYSSESAKPIPIGTSVNACHGFLYDLHKASGERDLDFGEWQPAAADRTASAGGDAVVASTLADGPLGLQVRTIRYIMPLKPMPMAPKQTRVVTSERIIQQEATRVLAYSCTATPDVPSGTSFTVQARICITASAPHAQQCRILVTVNVVWTKSSWIKGAVESASVDGQKRWWADVERALVGAAAAMAALHTSLDTTPVGATISAGTRLDPSVLRSSAAIARETLHATTPPAGATPTRKAKLRSRHRERDPSGDSSVADLQSGLLGRLVGAFRPPSQPRSSATQVSSSAAPTGRKSRHRRSSSSAELPAWLPILLLVLNVFVMLQIAQLRRQLLPSNHHQGVVGSPAHLAERSAAAVAGGHYFDQLEASLAEAEQLMSRVHEAIQASKQHQLQAFTSPRVSASIPVADG